MGCFWHLRSTKYSYGRTQQLIRTEVGNMVDMRT